MIYGVGVDLLAVERIRLILNSDGLAHFDKVLTPWEQAAAAAHPSLALYCASRFAAKEAVFKCLRTDVAFRLNLIEIQTDDAGRPFPRLSGQAKQIADDAGIVKIDLSLSYDTDYATAFAVASTAESNAY